MNSTTKRKSVTALSADGGTNRKSERSGPLWLPDVPASGIVLGRKLPYLLQAQISVNLPSPIPGLFSLSLAGDYRALVEKLFSTSALL